MNKYALTEDYGYWQGKNNKYKISWCDLCDAVIIKCLEKDCNGTSCNAMGCSKCIEDFQEFNKNVKTRIEEYLTGNEIKTYQKIKFLKGYILQSISDGDCEINWEKMNSKGYLCQMSKEMFKK